MYIQRNLTYFFFFNFSYKKRKAGFDSPHEKKEWEERMMESKPRPSPPLILEKQTKKKKATIPPTLLPKTHAKSRSGIPLAGNIESHFKQPPLKSTFIKY